MEVLEDGNMEGPVWAESERTNAPLSAVVCTWQPTLGVAPVRGWAEWREADDCRDQTGEVDGNNHSCYPEK